MTAIFIKTMEWYDYLEGLSDQRSKDLFLSNLLTPLIIVASYIYFILKLGPKLMEKRKPFDCKNTMIIYNVIQIVMNSILFYQILRAVWIPGEINFLCGEFDYSLTPYGYSIISIYHYYYINKIMDLADTVFMVLKKNQRQVTFLHVYHHSIMVCLSWFGLKYYAGGHGVMTLTINTLIHAIMYSYYLITCLAPKFRKNITWKKRVTLLQMVQFVLIGLHGTLVLRESCKIPKILFYFFFPQILVIFYLFADFFKTAYTKPAAHNKKSQ